MNGTAEELKLRAANLWVLPVDDDYNYKGAALDDSDKTMVEGGKNPWEGVGDNDHEDMLLFVGFPSVKDPSYNDRFPGKSACEIITTAHPDWFEQFNTSEKRQGERAKRASFFFWAERCQRGFGFVCTALVLFL
jgi:all-trans-retinol 13,14-reductase